MRTSLRRRLAAVATALGLASVGLLGAGTTPAQAAISDCPSGYFCAWKDANGTGTMFKTNTSKATLGTWDNAFETTVNRTSMIACLYDDANYGLSQGYSTQEPDPIATHWGDSAVSSVKLVRTARECEALPYPDWQAETAPKAAGFGDLNGDRTSDVLVRDDAGRLWFLPGDGTGRMVGSGGWNGFDALTRHGDFSRDGREDVIAREASTGKLWLYPGTGTGGLGTRKLIGSGGWNGMAKVTAFGDLSGDGRADLLAVEKSTGKLWMYPGTASGGLGARKLLGNGGWNSMNALVGAGDMNEDGRPDLVAREASTGKLWFYPGRAGTIGSRVLIGSGGWNGMQNILGVGDFNADGHFDLAAVDTLDGLVLYPGRGTGGLGAGVLESYGWWRLNGAF
ncbi:FG-GAP-like repeat-containing protein [Streptomyces sp. P9(2023)]|uniref:FG-GAP-like repeat-containing protein n=1 Tax=Streptomyces sp. P9(2023) TaxID=3064394 RepID=UPI0028F45DC3|nr:FG-GAP-like repeat-containing protein [Streptomyces sp. P9(2023)]MDT9690506.1 FG-GAP-like repeat-containing protein [Streptomyces sp. P9(2023)]